MSALLAKSLRSSTFKVALLCILVFGAAVLALFSYVYLATDDYVVSRSDRAIDADWAELIRAYDKGGQQALAQAINALRSENARADAVYLLAAPSFGRIAGNLPAWPDEAQGTASRINFAAAERPPGALQRPPMRARFATLTDQSHLLVGRNVGDLNQFMTRIHLALGLVALLVFVLAGVASVAVTRRTVGRIESINATTHAIMQSGLGKRVPLRGTDDEWDHLAGNLNSMLDRIEALMAEVRQVTDNVAHDLRPPLARVRGRLEKASFERRDAKADQALLRESMADLDDVLRMFASVTRISQVETTDRTAAFRKVDLLEIANGVAELFDAAAEVKHTQLAVAADGPAIVTGDRDLLFDALANLVDNAIKHGRAGGRVQIEIRRRDEQAVVGIADDGPGIPESERQNVFRRFYRLERSRRAPGNGLGLSLVAAVARLHDVPIKLLGNAPGLRVELRFPLSMAQAEAEHLS